MRPRDIDGPATPSNGPLFGAPPELRSRREPTIKEAVSTLVEFVDSSPAWDTVATAARIVLRDFKAQAQVGVRLEVIVHDVIKILEDARKPC